EVVEQYRLPAGRVEWRLGRCVVAVHSRVAGAAGALTLAEHARQRQGDGGEADGLEKLAAGDGAAVVGGEERSELSHGDWGVGVWSRNDGRASPGSTSPGLAIRVSTQHVSATAAAFATATAQPR